jgi:hypothetical protein
MRLICWVEVTQCGGLHVAQLSMFYTLTAADSCGCGVTSCSLQLVCLCGQHRPAGIGISSLRVLVCIRLFVALSAACRADASAG